MVGNFLSAHGFTPGPGEELAAMIFQRYSWKIIMTSSHKAPLLKIIDMIQTILFKKCNYDVAQVDVFSGRAFIWAEIATWLLCQLKKPIILTLRGGNLPIFTEAYPLRVKQVFSRAKVITAPSRFLKNEMEFRGYQVSLLPNAIPIKQYPNRLRDSPLPHFLWLRSFHNIYNPSLAPKVLARLIQEFPMAKLTMCGPDKGDGSLERTKEIAKSEDVFGIIQFPGIITKEEIPKFGNAHDLFLNTTNVDNTPISLVEAMAMGMCIVSTKVGGIPYLLENEKDALLVPPNDSTAMAAACRRLLLDGELAERLSRNAREKAMGFDWSVVLPQWEILLDSVLVK